MERRAILGAGIAVAGLALAVVLAFAEDIGFDGTPGAQAPQVAGLLACAGVIAAGAWLMGRSPLLTVLAAAALLAGLLDAWTTRHLIGADGVAYLDIGDQYLNGDISSAINEYWSPLYSIVTGTALALFSPSPSAEFAVVHGVNLLIYLGAGAAFVLFMRELLRYRDASLGPEAGRERTPTVVVWAVGLLAFGWGVGRLIGVGRVTPDLLVAVAWFVAMALLLRCLRDPGSTRTLIGLGLVLGAGYLTKNALLPIGLSMVAVLASAAGVRRALIVVAAGAALASPYVLAMSIKHDGPTLGSTSQLNYAWFVWGKPQQKFIPSEKPIPGLDHPPRRLVDRPPTFDIGKPTPATYPPWYDPTYWYAGTKPSFSPGAQREAFLRAWREYRRMLRETTGPALMIGLVLVLVLAAGRRGAWREARALARHWRLIAPALFGLVLYATIHVEPRFVGALMVSLAAVCYALLPWPSATRERIAAGFVIAAIVAVGVRSNLTDPVGAASRGLTKLEAGRRSALSSQDAAGALDRLGLGDCRRIALIGRPPVLVQTYLPRLAGMSIVVGITRPPPRWSVSADLRAALALARVDLLVGRRVPAGARGWLRLGSSDYFVYRPALTTRPCARVVAGRARRGGPLPRRQASPGTGRRARGSATGRTRGSPAAPPGAGRST